MKLEQAVRPFLVTLLVVLAAAFGYSAGLSRGQLLTDTEAAWIAANARAEASQWEAAPPGPFEEP